MSMFLARLRMLFAVLFNRPLRVQLRGAGEATFFPRQGLVLPVIAGADGEEDADGDGEDSGEGDGDGDDDGDRDGEGDGSGDGDDGEPKKDYRKELRRYERTIKRKRERDKKELKEAQDKLKQVEDAKKSETEKAIENAKEEGRSEALTKAEKERQQDRLEAACVRLAAKKVEIGEGEDKRKVRFEDPEDAEVFLQRKIAKGDLDLEDLFGDDGKVKSDILREVLKEILEEKPRLAEDSTSGKDDGKEKNKIPEGSGDGGKGKPADGEPSVEDLVKRKQQG